MPNQSGKIVLVLVLILLALGVSVYFFLPDLKQQKYIEQAPLPSATTNDYTDEENDSSGMKNYYSKDLKINLIVPSDAEVEEKLNNLKIVLSNGEIMVSFIGTNYADAKEYYKDLSEKHNLNPDKYREGSLGEYDYVMTSGKDPNDKTRIKETYFVYVDYGVYTFTTSHEALYPVLDQIVQSFEYKP